MANPKYPAVKLIHYAASRRLDLPLALTKLALYLAFLGKERNTAGAMTLAYASTICSLDGIAMSVYDTSKVKRFHRDSETAQPPPSQEGSGPHAGHDQRHHPQVWPPANGVAYDQDQAHRSILNDPNVSPTEISAWHLGEGRL